MGTLYILLAFSNLKQIFLVSQNSFLFVHSVTEATTLEEVGSTEIVPTKGTGEKIVEELVKDTGLEKWVVISILIGKNSVVTLDLILIFLSDLLLGLF